MRLGCWAKIGRKALQTTRGMTARRRQRWASGSPSEVLETRLLLTTPPAGPTLTDGVGRDFNGDGFDDVVEMGDDGQWWVGVLDSASSTRQFQTSVWDDWSDASNFTHVDFADFNRDQNADILGIDLWGNVWVGLSNGSDAFTTTLWATGFVGDLAHVAIGDADSDLYADLIAFTADGSWQVALSNHTNGFDATTQWADWADASNFAHVAVGDFDGDRSDDDVAGMDHSGNWWVATSNAQRITDFYPPPGDGTAFVGTSVWADWADSSAFAKIETADFNGDGATDIAGFDHSGNWWVATSNFKPAIPNIEPGTAFVGTSMSADWADASNFLKVGVGDFNGDGAADFAGLDASGNWWVRAPYSSQTQPTVVVITTLWASWGDVSNLREVDLANFDGTATDVARFDDDGRWRVGTSAFGTNVDHPPSRFLENTFWADWDPADTYATVNGGLSIKQQLNELPLV